jgi:predicted ATPase
MTPSRSVYAKAAKAAKAAEKLQTQKESDPQLSLELHDRRANKSIRWAQLSEGG